MNPLLRRALAVAVIVIVLAFGALAAVAYFGGESDKLPFQYEGFE